jgi:hypothetical protein
MVDGVLGNQVQFNSGIAFVGSTLPAAALSKQIESGEITKIYVSHKKFIESYLMLIKHAGVSIDIEDASDGSKVGRFLKLLAILHKIKKNKAKIFVYHECCWIWLDICIWIIKPHGIYRPQANLQFMFRPVNSSKFFYKHLPFIMATQYSVLRFLFRFGYAINDHKDGIIFAPIIRKYPRSIITETCTEITPSSKGKDSIKGNRLLILSGSDCASSEEMISIYTAIALKAMSMDYKVAIKDHPNQNSRLNFIFQESEIINPALPVEIMEDNYSLVVGTASAAMAIFGSRAISIANLLGSMSCEDKIQRINYIQSLNPEVRIAKDIEDIFIA